MGTNVATLPRNAALEWINLSLMIPAMPVMKSNFKCNVNPNK